jgi:hypothetical protein
MPSKGRDQRDDTLRRIDAVLAKYRAEHPRAKAEAKRQNSASIRVRVIDPDFAGTSKFDRHDAMQKYLDALSAEDFNEVSMLLLLAPDEVKHSIANLEFEEPSRSPIW